ncbi:MAG: hypothetical protein ACYC0Y_04930 [Pirellulales bacterium]
MRLNSTVLRWIGSLLIGLVLIGLVVDAWCAWATDKRLESQLAAIRAAGDPVSIADLAPKPFPPEQNAATYLRQAEAGLISIEDKTSALDYPWELPGFLMPAEDQKIVKAALATAPDVIPLLERAAACPHYRPELDYTLSAETFFDLSSAVGRPREAGIALCFRAALLVAEGKHDEAARTALVTFRLARHFDQVPLMTGYCGAGLVRRYAFRTAAIALQTGSVSKDVRDALDAELARQERLEGCAWALKSERAHNLDLCREVAPSRHVRLLRGFWSRPESECLEAWELCLALPLDRDPYCETERIIRTIYQGKLQGMSPWARLLMPDVDLLHGFGTLVTDRRAQMRALRVLNALQTHVPPGSKEIPKLSELGLPAEAITDPFTGKPLHVKKTPRGWLVYSVAQNLRDDGGKLDDSVDGDVGVGPPPVAKSDEKEQDGKKNEGGG